MGCPESKVATEAEEVSSTKTTTPEPSLAKVDQLTSTAYSAANPPKDWQDTVFLVPHEWLRREMMALQKSVEALDEKPTKEDNWKVLNLAKWLKEVFVVIVKMRE